jgi:hypothetical protein
MPLLPERTREPGVLSLPQTRQAAHELGKAELKAFRHGLEAAVVAECDRQDAQAAADACSASLEAELDLLDYGLHRANGSAAKTELVARKVNRLAAINDSRIARRFGR